MPFVYNVEPGQAGQADFQPVASDTKESLTWVPLIFEPNRESRQFTSIEMVKISKLRYVDHISRSNRDPHVMWIRCGYDMDLQSIWTKCIGPIQPAKIRAIMSSSDEEASIQEETWDDMAIVRAFEDAMRGKRGAEKKTTTAPNSKNGSRSGRKTQAEQRRKQSVASSRTADAWATRDDGTMPLPQTPSYAQTPQSQEEVYQAAYAQAYAQLQAQMQASNTYPYTAPHQHQQHQIPAPTQAYAGQTNGYGYGPEWAPQHQHPPAPPPPRMPFPSMPSGPSTAPQFPGAGLGQDDLSNLLLSWYQSGYYTGRYQAMQEMHAKGFR